MSALSASYPESIEVLTTPRSPLVTDAVYRTSFLDVVATLLSRGNWPADLAADAQRIVGEIERLKRLEAPRETAPTSETEL